MTTPALGLAPPDDSGTVTLADGRRLAWSSWGPTRARPTLFFTGAGMSGRLGFGTHLLKGSGIRLVAIDRPGLGRSDPDRNRTLESWAVDVAALLDDLDCDRPTGVAFSQGAPFALACAAAGQLERLVMVAGQDDLSHPDVRRQLPHQIATLVDATRSDPEGVQHAMEPMGTPDAILDLVRTTSSPRDLRVYDHPDFAAAYRACLSEGLAQGPAGYARDVVLAMGSWPFHVEAITCPVALWYGAHDRSAVHSPDHGATLSARLPRATRHVVPDAGGSLLWTHPAVVLDALCGEA